MRAGHGLQLGSLRCTQALDAMLHAHTITSVPHHAMHLQAVIERERRGDYLGKTVQVVPHITDAIQVTAQLHAGGAA
jgi:CTP synthase (UTP-ammonia lyase)